ncbi:MAG: hypothetical protein ICV74_04950 [Thermoleophilia bacterium]|nr:hypothetical protein [Thermoleophilia bacterium]
MRRRPASDADDGAREGDRIARGVERLVGSRGADELTGSEGRDYLDGSGGDEFAGARRVRLSVGGFGSDPRVRRPGPTSSLRGARVQPAAFEESQRGDGFHEAAAPLPSPSLRRLEAALRPARLVRRPAQEWSRPFLVLALSARWRLRPRRRRSTRRINGHDPGIGNLAGTAEVDRGCEERSRTLVVVEEVPGAFVPVARQGYDEPHAPELPTHIGSLVLQDVDLALQARKLRV